MRRVTRSGVLTKSLLSLLGLALTVGAAYARKEYGPGVSDTEIKIGQTMPYSGPASAYGRIGKAEAAYFKMINEHGGVNGRKITLISLDDSYSPPKTVEQTRKLVEKEEVLLLFNSLGTPTNTATHKYVNQKGVPQLFVASGATKWGDPKHYPWTIGWQPNYQTEARAYAAYILEHLPDARIGVLYQNDDYGKDYLQGFHDGLGDKAATMIVKEVSYETSDPTVNSQIVTLKSSGADVFFDITTPKFAAQAIRKAYEINWHPVHFLNNVSASTAAVLKPAGLKASKGIITAGYGKDLTDPQWQTGKDYDNYVAWMKKYFPKGKIDDANIGYGYLVAMTLVHVLRQCGDNLSRVNVMRHAVNIQNLELPLLLPGVVLNTSPRDYFPIEAVRLEKFNGERWELFGDLIRADRS
jgi:ABC-type branched-subunit amino acid transport system substrate-binding protein